MCIFCIWRELYCVAFSSHCSATVELRQLEVLEAKFTLEAFNTFMFTRMVLLVPAMQLQRTLQKVFCGRSFWREQTQNRKDLYPEHNYVSIAHLLNPVCQMLYVSDCALHFLHLQN